jgi:hypothetical protein
MSCSKLSYPTQWMARRAMRAISRDCQRLNLKCPAGTYLCGECRTWHITSQPGHQIPPWVKARAKG